MQQALLDLANPLDLKIGKDFFSTIPRSAGVYKMYDDDGHILYVGKAKNLRTRLMSYRRIKITSQSRKSIRLVHQISEIKWEECKDEEAALVRENDLLRSLKPPFNVVNTAPETYFYFTVKVLEEDANEDTTITGRTPIVLTLSMNPADPEAAVFGAFKGLASSHRAFFALKRLLWLVSDRKEEDDFYYPIHLIRRQRLYPHHCALEKVWLNRLAGFFHGISLSPTQREPDLIVHLREIALVLKNCDPFHAAWVNTDIDSLAKFYRTGPARNARLKAFSMEDSATIEKNKVDDLLVKNHFARNKLRKVSV